MVICRSTAKHTYMCIHLCKREPRVVEHLSPDETYSKDLIEGCVS